MSQPPIQVKYNYGKIAVNEFMFGGSAKATFALCHKSIKEGGLGIPHLQARLNAIRSQWVAKLMNKDGPWTMIFNGKGINWNLKESFDTLFPERVVI
jgi:hypothetical protein